MNCQLFDENNKKLEQPDSQSNLFKNTTHFKKLLYHVSRRLGLTTLLPDQMISELWDECRYQETYNLKKLSPWCAVSLKLVDSFIKIENNIFFSNHSRHLIFMKPKYSNICPIYHCTINFRMEIH